MFLVGVRVLHIVMIIGTMRLVRIILAADRSYDSIYRYVIMIFYGGTDSYCQKKNSSDYAAAQNNR